MYVYYVFINNFVGNEKVDNELFCEGHYTCYSIFFTVKHILTCKRGTKEKPTQNIFFLSY